jgi:hypothetical protein
VTRPCLDCGALSDRTRCPAHEQRRNRARGSTTDRGYGAAHQQLRARWAPVVAAGDTRCARCQEVIQPDEPWDLGHDDTDRARYAGPEHARRCNRAAGGAQTPRGEGRS